MYKRYIVPILILLALIALGGWALWTYCLEQGYIVTNTPNVETSTGQSLGINPTSTPSKNATKASVKQESNNLSVSPSNMQSIVQQMFSCYNKAHAENNQVVGWIYVAGTRVDYPVMAGMNTQFWLSHNWLDKPDVDGSIFRDENLYSWGPVNVIHGHNMANVIFGDINNIKHTMFASLTWLKNPADFRDADGHLIYLCTGNQVIVYKLFSILIVDPEFQFDYTASTPSQLEQYAKLLASKSVLPAHPVTDKPLLLLNTCSFVGKNTHQITCAQEVSVYNN